MALVIQKFGGSSLQTVERVQSAAQHVASCWEAGDDVVVVVSAMGKQTDHLTALAKQVSFNPPAREVDMLLTAGERISMALMAIALDSEGVPSISLTGSQTGIVTDSVHGNARIKKVLGDRVRNGLSERQVVIVAGFQGVSSEEKNVTTLGRGGSDLTAVALSVAFKADRCELYKDVTGLFTAHPGKVSGARKIDIIGWDHAEILSQSGAGVLHSRAAFLAKKYSVPLEIRSSLELSERGTLLGETRVESAQVTSITSMSDLIFGTYQFSSGADKNTATQVTDWLWTKGIAPIYFVQRASDDGFELEVAYPAELQTEFEEKCLHAINGFIKSHADEKSVASITLVGHGLRQGSEIMDSAIDCFDELPQMVIPSQQSIMFLVKGEKETDYMNRLHAKLFGN